MRVDISTKHGMAQAVIWQTSMIRMIKEGGAWGIPRSCQLIQIFHANKIAVFLEGQDGMNLEPDIVKVFKAMGWRCVDSAGLRAAMAVKDADDAAKEFID